MDDALNIRTAALNCVEEIVSSMSDNISTITFLDSFSPKLANLLIDKDEIRLQTYQVLHFCSNMPEHYLILNYFRLLSKCVNTIPP